MEIDQLTGSIFGIEIIWIKDWDTTLKKVLENINFDLAVKYDEYWTDFYNNPKPYSEYEENEIQEYMAKNGTIVNESPLAWAMNNNIVLLNIIYGFINANQNVIAKIDVPIERLIRKFQPAIGEDEVNLVEFWAENSHYFLTTLSDFSGLIFVSKSRSKIDRIKNKLEPYFEKKQLKKVVGL